MALTPLTRVQQATVLALVEARRLDVVRRQPADLARARSFLRQPSGLGVTDVMSLSLDHIETSGDPIFWG